MTAMNEIDQKLHAAIHQSMMNVSPGSIFSPRVGVFSYVESRIGIEVRGRVLDMGCGSGYVSIWLARLLGQQIDAPEYVKREILKHPKRHILKRMKKVWG
jgi:2-polyprenyl-3-methyl-5-hydroxy-6-metoxy-1,4-benzoquinol methylase